MANSRHPLSLDPIQAAKSLERNLAWTPDGCATSKSRQLYIRTADGGSVGLYASRVAHASTHGWVTSPGKLRRTCSTPRCVNPDHLEVIASESGEDDRPPVDLDRVAYMRAREWTWQLIGETTGWTAQDVADIPHVRRIHESLKTDAIAYIERLNK
ncbi:hypothetical protein [Cutibacterium avidum]|uniref:hypothetical protein n=1 Tax=Cutibacterium avidum TaxID=33010 RepID=UPI002FF25CA1